MNAAAKQWELLVLTADKNAQSALEGLLGRPQALGIRPIQALRILVHPRRDPAVLRDSHNFLRPFLGQARYCLVVFDREGSGERNRGRDELEGIVQSNLDANGWQGRSAVVVIDPELEAWVWSDSPQADAVLGWPCGGRQLRQWLMACGLLQRENTKPSRPKEAVETALRESRTSRSSALYKALAVKMSFKGCTDAAFGKLRRCLAAWFPAGNKGANTRIG